MKSGVGLSLIPVGNAGVIVAADHLALVPTLVLDIDLQPLLKPDWVGCVPPVHAVVLLLHLQVSAVNEGVGMPKSPTRTVFVFSPGGVGDLLPVQFEDGISFAPP